MKKRLIPDLFVDSIHEFDIEQLKTRHIEGIIVDIDNTLVSWESELADQRTIELVEKLKQNGFKICILSNNSKKRVELFNQKMQLPAIHKARKPRRGNFRKAMSIMGTKPENTAVIGDQIFTDILGGNRLGLFTVLVKPISNKEFIGTQWVRKIERLFVKNLQ